MQTNKIHQHQFAYRVEKMKVYKCMSIFFFKQINDPKTFFTDIPI